MQRLLFTLTIALVTCCTQREKVEQEQKTDAIEPTIEDKADRTQSALAFINEYNDNRNKMAEGVNIVDWVTSNNLTTRRFKEELKILLDEAYKVEPEVGLDFDPILNAQDNPDKGFEIESFDEPTNYLTVKGIDWPDFKVVIKVVEENGNWLVDGCGIINIPKERQNP